MIAVAGQSVHSGGMVGLLLNNFVSAQIKSVFAAAFFLSLLGISLVLIAKISIKNIFIFLARVLRESGRSCWRFFSAIGWKASARTGTAKKSSKNTTPPTEISCSRAGSR